MNIKQKTILRKLVQNNGLRFSELSRYFSYEDKFPYHLKYLLSKGFISKRNNFYYITKVGMGITSTFDTITLEDIKTSTPRNYIICEFEDKFLICVHFGKDKNPQRKFYTLPSITPLWGKSIEESNQQDFYRKHKIKPEFNYFATLHLVTYTSDDFVLFDNISLIYKAKINREDYELSRKSELWMTINEIVKLPQLSFELNKYVIEKESSRFMDAKTVLNYGIEEVDL